MGNFWSVQVASLPHSSINSPTPKRMPYTPTDAQAVGLSACLGSVLQQSRQAGEVQHSQIRAALIVDKHSRQSPVASSQSWLLLWTIACFAGSWQLHLTFEIGRQPKPYMLFLSTAARTPHLSSGCLHWLKVSPRGLSMREWGVTRELWVRDGKS